jgi:hypothetical protein
VLEYSGDSARIDDMLLSGQHAIRLGSLYPISARIGVLFGCETVAAFSNHGTIKRATHVKRTLNSAWRVLAIEKLATPGFLAFS